MFNDSPTGRLFTRQSALKVLLPLLVFGGFMGIWFAVGNLRGTNGSLLVPNYVLPRPGEVWDCFGEEWNSGRLLRDVVASLYCVSVAFLLAAGTGIPFGLFLGQYLNARLAFQPMVNFFRCLSPIAWIPFAISWFGIGSGGEIFLIFMASFFPLVLSTLSAVSTVPAVRFRVANDYDIRGWDRLIRVTLPAILPQVIMSLRVTAGIAWVVVVAAEMAGVQHGLGFGIDDARDALRLDIVVCYMVVIGFLGVGIDRLLAQLTRLPNVRWGYDR